ncbi:hypothetical protein VTI74DRAFT_6651 [Chaetomium olivicolor]
MTSVQSVALGFPLLRSCPGSAELGGSCLALNYPVSASLSYFLLCLLPDIFHQLSLVSSFSVFQDSPHTLQTVFTLGMFHPANPSLFQTQEQAQETPCICQTRPSSCSSDRYWYLPQGCDACLSLRICLDRLPQNVFEMISRCVPLSNAAHLGQRSALNHPTRLNESVSVQPSGLTTGRVQRYIIQRPWGDA